MQNFSIPLVIYRDYTQLPWKHKTEFKHLGFDCYYFEQQYPSKSKAHYLKILDKSKSRSGFYYKRIRHTNYWVLCEFYAKCPESVTEFKLLYERGAYG